MFDIIKSILIVAFIMLIVLVGSIDLDKTEDNIRNNDGNVSVSICIENNI